jgi:bacteriorhodopsin
MTKKLLNDVFDGISAALFFIAAVFYRFKASYDKHTTRMDVIRFDKTVVLNTLSAIISLISAWCSIISIVDILTVPIQGASRSVNLIRYIDWILTCPLLQIQLGLIADTKTSRYIMMVYNVTVSNTCGLIGAYVDTGIWKVVFLLISCGHFAYMSKDLDNLVQEHTDNQESLMRGTSSLRKLCLMTIGTWIPFPIIWVLSSDGFDWAQWGTISEVMFNIIGVVSKLSVDTAIALMKLEEKIEEESVSFRSRASSLDASTMGLIIASPSPPPSPPPRMAAQGSFQTARSPPPSPPPSQMAGQESFQTARNRPPSPKTYWHEDSDDVEIPIIPPPRRRSPSPTPTFYRGGGGAPYITPLTLWNATFHPVKTAKSALRSFLFA